MMTGGRQLYKAACEKTVRFLFKAYFSLVHRVRIEGRENIPKAFTKLIVISNHASLLDGILLWTYLDLPLKILVDRERARERLLKPFMQNDYTIQIDSMNPYSLKTVIERVNEGIPLLVFPEGRITRTGNLMKIYEGTGFVALKTGAGILPVHIGNSFETIFSRKQKGKRVFAPLTLTIGRFRPSIDVESVQPRKRKREATKAVYEILCETYYGAHNRPATLGQEFIRACRKYGRKSAYMDATAKEVSYKRALMGAFALGDYCCRFSDRHIGILLPNLTVTALFFMGLQLFRKVPVFLNYASGPAALKHAMGLAEVGTIITSREFLARIKLDSAVFEGKRLIYAEEIGEAIRFPDKLRALWRSTFTGSCGRMEQGGEQETAVVLFTSGSEGLPKGVCLSHENIISNIHQALSKVDVTEDDYFMNVLPMFHSFGLTIGTILPLFAGARVFLYVSPLHYRIIPEIIYDQGCTILMGTNTFLNGFSKRAHPYDFHSLRYVFCGAEALSGVVFDRYARIHGIRVMSGYGATECAPIISINTVLEHEYGTVGRPLPGIACKVVPEEGIDAKNGRVGRLFVKGKNVMKGYLKNDGANHKYLIEDQGWYDTGDIVEISGEGFIRIEGRLKRFSKISGEMISLTAIEEALAGHFGERKEIALLGIPDEAKGERLVLVTNNPAVELKAVREILKQNGFSELTFPREVKFMKEIPKLGTGKTDYIKLKELLGKIGVRERTGLLFPSSPGPFGL